MKRGATEAWRGRAEGGAQRSLADQGGVGWLEPLRAAAELDTWPQRPGTASGQKAQGQLEGNLFGPLSEQLASALGVSGAGKREPSSDDSPVATTDRDTASGGGASSEGSAGMGKKQIVMKKVKTAARRFVQL